MTEESDPAGEVSQPPNGGAEESGQVTTEDQRQRHLLQALLLSIGVFLFIALALVYPTFGFGSRARVLPQLVGIPTMVIAGFVVMSEWRARRADPADDEEFGEEAVHSEVSAFAWIGGFLSSLLLIGFLWTVPLYVITYMRFHGKETWRLTLALAAGLTAFVYLVLIEVLRVPVVSGLLL